jgi:RNA polymerase sigma-70 factor (ECF subfamily)
MIELGKYLAKMNFRALALTKDQHAAEDLVQDTCLKVLEKQHMFDGKFPMAWICKIMQNIFYDRCKRSEIVKFVELSDAIENMVLDKELAEGPEIPHNVCENLRDLSDAYRDVFILRVQGLDYNEISKKLKISTGTVASRLGRARKAIAAA